MVMAEKSDMKTLKLYLRERVESLRGIDFPGDITQASQMLAIRYQELAVSGLDYKGQLSSAYGEGGISGALALSYDFGQMALPSLMTASVQVGLSGTHTRKSMVVLQRLPQAVYRTGASGVLSALAANGVAPLPEEVWRTSRPVALIVLEGNVYQGGLNVEGQVGVSIEPPVTIDEVGAELSATLTARADGGVTILRLEHVLAGYYPSPDDGVALQIELNAALVTLLGGPTRAEAKAEVKRWLDATQEKFPKDGQPIPPSKRRRVWKRIKVLLPDSVPGTDKLVAQLTALKARLQSAAYERPSDRYADILQVDKYLSLLQYDRKPPAAIASVKPYYNFLHLYSFLVSGEAKAGVTAGVTGPREVASAEASAAATLGGQVQLIGYRYQTLANTSYPTLVITQDTFVTYRQVGASVAAEAGISVELANYGKSIGRELSTHYRTMTYQSVITYWLYPLAVSSTPGQRVQVSWCNGSGVVFGCSASLGRLIAVARAPDDASSLKYLARLARQLRLDPYDIAQFLLDSQLATLDPAQDGLEKATTVFLETSFAFDPAVQLQAELKERGGARSYVLQDPLRLPWAKAFKAHPRIHTGPLVAPKSVTPGGPSAAATVPRPQPSQQRGPIATPPPAAAGPGGPPTVAPLLPLLEALRLRFRIADVHESVRPLFKLGFTSVVGFNVDISQVRGAGHEGFLDYYVQWFNNPLYNESPDASKTAMERSVPPVALLHQ